MIFFFAVVPPSPARAADVPEQAVAAASSRSLDPSGRASSDLAAVYPPYPEPTIPIVVSISLNGESRGDYFVQRDKAGNILIRREDLKALGLRAPDERSVFIQDEWYVPLNAVRDSAATFDEKTLTVSIVAKHFAAPRAVIDLTPPSQRKNVYYPRETSAFLNYGLSYAYTDPDGFQSFTATNKLGARTNDVFFVTDTLYTETERSSDFVRLMSSATYERRGDLQWFVMGDQFASSGNLGSTINIGGIGFSKVYQVDPYFIKQPMFSLSGMAIFPSQAEIYLDGVFVGRYDVRPGEFDLKNFNYYGGAHTFEVRIKDSFGNEQRFVYPAYFTDILLRKGLYEYSYNVGFLREQYGTASNEYGKAAFSAFHRYGVTDSLNLGARAEGSEGVYNGGVQASFVVPRVGTITIAGAESSDHGTNGSAGSFLHTYQWKSFSTNVSARGYSKDYVTLAAIPVSGPVKLEAGVGAGFTVGTWGGLSIGYSESEKYSGEHTNITSATYSRSLSRSSSIFVTGRTIREHSTEYDVFIGFIWNPGKDTQFTSHYQRTGNVDTETAQYQKNIPVGEGLGYRASLNRAETGGTTIYSANPFMQYNAPYGTYSLDAHVQHVAGGETSEAFVASAAGSLMYAGGFFGISRPVNDSFAIVLAEDLPGVKVMLNSNEITRVGADGTAAIPTMGSYGDNRITLDAGNIPMDITTSGAPTNISPSLWSGACVSFDAARVQAVIGRLVAQRAGRKEPIEFHEVTMLVGEREVTFPTGKGGEFYFENFLPPEKKTESIDSRNCRAITERRKVGHNVIKPGVYPATVDYEGQKCSFRITVPHTEDVMTDLGEIQCVITQVSEPARPAQEKAAPEAEKPASLSEVKSPAPDTGTLAVKANDKKPLTLIVQLPFDKEGYPANKKDVKIISNILRRLSLNPNLMIEIETHCDRRGSDAVNMKIGMKRSLVIKKYLILSGVPEEKIIKTITFGKRKPICKKPTDECNTKNRRGIIRLVAKGGNGDVTQVESHY